MSYTKDEIRRPMLFAMEAARARSKRVTVVDKANVLETSKLWRAVAKEFIEDPKYSDIKVDFMYVDNAAMQLVTNPTKFDVIVTSNMFGDILSDLGSTLPGSLGLMPSASMNAIGKRMLFEAAGGSAPDIAGKGIANPIAQVC